MFAKHRARGGCPTALERARDIVEIVAIIAAGTWALYTFVYENRIKPAYQPASLEFKATMHRLGQRDGLIAVGLDTITRNLGVTRVQFLGFSYYVEGVRVFASSHPTYPEHLSTRSVMFEGYRYSARRVVVWRTAYVSHVGNPTETADLFLDPGNADERNFLFYIRAGRFDQLVASINAIYTKSSHLGFQQAWLYLPRAFPPFLRGVTITNARVRC
jgi:hypothetical protein